MPSRCWCPTCRPHRRRRSAWTMSAPGASWMKTTRATTATGMRSCRWDHQTLQRNWVSQRALHSVQERMPTSFKASVTVCWPLLLLAGPQTQPPSLPTLHAAAGEATAAASARRPWPARCATCSAPRRQCQRRRSWGPGRQRRRRLPGPVAAPAALARPAERIWRGACCAPPGSSGRRGTAAGG